MQPSSAVPKHPIDMHVGMRVRRRRAALGMNQQRLGAAVGLSFQQIQKYESGANRISSSRLYEFAKVLKVPVAHFFKNVQTNMLRGPGAKKFAGVSIPSDDAKDPFIKPETMELVRAYYKIREGKIRKRIFEMVKAVGAARHGEVLARRKRR